MNIKGAVGIGSPLLDIVVNVDDDILAEIDLKKGEMHLIDSGKSKEILSLLRDSPAQLSPGGSAANTIAGLSTLGSPGSFIGVIGKDNHGKIYSAQTQKLGTVTKLIEHDTERTGHAITFITVDGERTFATHLGAANQFRKKHIEDADIEQGKILYIEGYQLEDLFTREGILHALEVANSSEIMVAMDLSDPGLIRRNKQIIQDIVKEYVSIVFVNEEEAYEFTGKREQEALDEIYNSCDIAVIKLGERGSIIKAEDAIHLIEPHRVDVINTNGAGDMYAAGFLHGILNNYDIPTAGRLASQLAALVVESPGARLENNQLPRAKEFILDAYKFRTI